MAVKQLHPIRYDDQKIPQHIQLLSRKHFAIKFPLQKTLQTVLSYLTSIQYLWPVVFPFTRNCHLYMPK